MPEEELKLFCPLEINEVRKFVPPLTKLGPELLDYIEYDLALNAEHPVSTINDEFLYIHEKVMVLLFSKSGELAPSRTRADGIQE